MAADVDTPRFRRPSYTVCYGRSVLRDDELRRALCNPSWRSMYIRVSVIYFRVGMNTAQNGGSGGRSTKTTGEATWGGARKQWNVDVDSINNA